MRGEISRLVFVDIIWLVGFWIWKKNSNEKNDSKKESTVDSSHIFKGKIYKWSRSQSSSSLTTTLIDLVEFNHFN